MNKTVISRALLALCLTGAPFAAFADHHMEHHGDSGPGMHQQGHHQGHYNFDPVNQAEQRLGELEKALNLTAQQQSAWKTYSDAVMARAGEKAARMEEFHSRRGEMHNLDTASKLEKRAQWLRDRAERLEKMAQDTRALQQALAPEQQAIFDEYWRTQRQRGNWRRHHSS